jgi:imidazolonepropionase-like amidohydrolase
LGRQKEIGTLEAGKLADVSILEDRSRFVAVMQGGVVKAGKAINHGLHG